MEPGVVAALITSAATLWVAWRTKRNVSQVHVLVNQRMTDAVARIEQLTAALEGSDTDVPRDPADVVE